MNDIELKLKAKIPSSDTGIEVRKSICAICDPGTQCGLDLFVKDGEIIKVAGAKEAPHSHGTLCCKGAATRQYVYNPDRVLTPLRRTGERGMGMFEPISWDDALDEIARRLNDIKSRHGAESVVFFAGYPKWFRAYLQRFALQFGSPNYITESSTCATAMVMAQQLTYGAPAEADWNNARCMLVWSHNPSATKTLNLLNIRKRLDEGMRLIVVDPRVTYLAQRADVFLQLRPGTDGALALAMANVIIGEELYDKRFVAQWTKGFDEFAQLAAQMTPERAAEICGVDASAIREAARLYATTAPAAIHMSASPVVHHTNGVQNYRAVSCLIGLTGNIDIAGGNRMNLPSLAHMPGGFPTREGEFTRRDLLSTLPPRIGQGRFPIWSKLCAEAQGLDLVRQVKTGDPYPVKALFALGLNYRMFPDSQGFINAISTLDFIVDADLFLTDSAKYADIVLPACSSVERREARCWPMGYLTFTQPAIKPIGESRSDVDILAELAKRLELGDELLEGGIEKCVGWILEPSGVTVAQLDKHPEGMWVPGAKPPAQKKYRERGFNTPSGKLEFESSLLGEFDREGYEALPVYREPKMSPLATPEIAAQYPLVLNLGSRLPMYQHSRTFRVPWNRQLDPDPKVDISFADAARYGIGDGQMMRVITPHGSLVARAKVGAMVREGDVHMYHDWPQANANDLLDGDYVDPISGFPGYRSSLCRIEPVEPSALTEGRNHE